MHAELFRAFVWSERLQWLVRVLPERRELQRLGTVRVLAELRRPELRGERLWRLVRELSRRTVVQRIRTVCVRRQLFGSRLWLGRMQRIVRGVHDDQLCLQRLGTVRVRNARVRRSMLPGRHDLVWGHGRLGVLRRRHVQSRLPLLSATRMAAQSDDNRVLEERERQLGTARTLAMSPGATITHRTLLARAMASNARQARACQAVTTSEVCA